MDDRIFIAALAALNLAGGLAGAWLLTNVLSPPAARPKLRALLFLVCLGVYCLECVAFAAGMATQVCVLALAVVWGIVLGRWLPYVVSLRRSWRVLVLVGGYTSFPTLSFCILLPLAFALGRGSIVSPQAGLEFGMPDFVPLPLQTVLGFCLALGCGTLFLKCVITTVVASWVSHHRWRLSPSGLP
jgi:hypothetical protein